MNTLLSSLVVLGLVEDFVWAQQYTAVSRYVSRYEYEFGYGIGNLVMVLGTLRLESRLHLERESRSQIGGALITGR